MSSPARKRRGPRTAARPARLGAALVSVALGAAALTQAGSAAPPARGASGPCGGPNAASLLCPNLKIGAPRDIYLEHARGHVLLRATSDVQSRGSGPIELRGRRIGPRKMKTRQRIFKAAGGHRDIATKIHLHFTNVGGEYGGSFWKVHNLATFELWSVDSSGAPVRVVRESPKLNYCLRDLERTQPGPRSPGSRHYPGCNQDPGRRGVRLGTSVGWSDIYPSTYDKQWIDVTGLRGCFAYVMRVDPAGALFESEEDDNTNQRLVHLPWSGDNGC